jgi:hypothetical protein
MGSGNGNLGVLRTLATLPDCATDSLFVSTADQQDTYQGATTSVSFTDRDSVRITRLRQLFPLAFSCLKFESFPECFYLFSDAVFESTV